jgi:hypothetical protein
MKKRAKDEFAPSEEEQIQQILTEIKVLKTRRT